MTGELPFYKKYSIAVGASAVFNYVFCHIAANNVSCDNYSSFVSASRQKIIDSKPSFVFLHNGIEHYSSNKNAFLACAFYSVKESKVVAYYDNEVYVKDILTDSASSKIDDITLLYKCVDSGVKNIKQVSSQIVSFTKALKEADNIIAIPILIFNKKVDYKAVIESVNKMMSSSDRAALIKLKKNSNDFEDYYKEGLMHNIIEPRHRLGMPF